MHHVLQTEKQHAISSRDGAGPAVVKPLAWAPAALGRKTSKALGGQPRLPRHRAPAPGRPLSGLLSSTDACLLYPALSPPVG